jgi:hypothetical protein
VFIVIDPATVIEAWPDGARWADVAEYEDEQVAYGIVAGAGRLRAVADAARGMDGVGYGLRDYMWHAAYRRGLPVPGVERRAADRGRMLPGQFVAEACARAGIDLFPGREPWDVTVSDLVAEFAFNSRDWEIRINNTHLL